MTEEQRRRLRAVKTFAQLISFLRDELDWPIDQEGHDEDDLTFDWSDDLGLKDEERVGIKEIKQLRPLETGQPWGIFFVNFEKKNLPIVILRRILNALVLKKRASANRAQQAAWQQRDLLFISAYGQESERQLTFAHFSEPTNDFDPSKATLRVLGWDDDDTSLKLDYVADTLKAKLTWPTDTADLKDWRQRWSEAFELRHREVIDTAADLALRLAELATRIRNRMLQVLPRESESGELRKLLKGFQAALIHDLDEARFADMYAQTITYGLFSAAVSRTVPGAGTAVHQGNVVDMVPVTNPFLREMLSSFLKAGGRRGKLDFDELGIQEVVDLLNDPKTHMEAVLRDFGNRRRGEDPVIHFYEEFLKAYDKKLKVQRGVFYTPQPVVSYIVRSVHELLQTEFGLADGLADITTWGEMLSRHPGLKLPPLTDDPNEARTISANEPFVQILDPATGTATFLVEVIDVIYRTLAAKWKQQRLTDAQQRAAWNDYVPTHLLPRLHAFELMMAPYAIAHMKIGLKLAETGYRFGTEERARIYLTNALEPWVRQLPLIGFDALAHEAAAVNEVKRLKRFTVVIGNPPYSKISSNLTPEMRATVERYRYLDGEKIKERGALQFEINLQDDYVKFFRLCEEKVGAANIGVLGLITNNGYLSTPTLRGMRDSLLETFSSMWVFDLHGHVAKGEIGPDGAQEENVFDIVQGVSVFLGSRTQPKINDGSVLHTERYGSRAGKYSFLQSHDRTSTSFTEIAPSPPFYLYVPHDADLTLEWKQYVGLAELFPKSSAGIITARDGLVIAENRRELAERLERFSHAKGSEDSIYEEFGFSQSKRFDLRAAQSELRKLKSFSEPIRRILHRPFDERFVFFNRSVVWSLSRPMADEMEDGKNLALVATRQVTRPQFEHAYVSRHIIEIKACSHDRNTQIFPLFICGSDGELALSSGATPNLNQAVLTILSKPLGLKLNSSTRELGRDHELSALRLFHFAYAILQCPSYRKRYFEFLRSDFPRLPLTGNLEMFRALALLGGELTALHLLESPKLAQPITEFMGGGNPVVEKISWSRATVWVDKSQTTGFQGVHEDVWKFRIGGYQVCEKWLKDRKGRTLSEDDIAHYQKIVVALSETIRLMAEIDRVIDAHGGWPGAFQTAAAIA
jgi:hypothetical protein